MLDQAKNILARLEAMMGDITLLSQEVGKIENRDKVSLEIESKLVGRAMDLSIKENKLRDDREQLEKDREELNRFSGRFAVREKQIIEKEGEISKQLEGLENLKKELAKRELTMVDNEEERARLEIDKRDFEVIRSKVEKERLIARDRKEMLDERERKISVKEELLKRRLGS